MKQRQSSHQGFTLIELLVGITITGVILLGVLSMTFLLFSSNLRVKQLDAIEQTKYDLQNEFSNNVRWATDVTILPSGKGFTVMNSDGQSTTYLLQNNQLLKNSNPLTSADVLVTDMTVVNNSVSPNLISLDIHLALQQKSFAAVHNTAHIVVSQRKIEISSH